MPFEVLALILAGAAALLAQLQLSKGDKKERPELAPVRVPVRQRAARRRSR